eukprot:UC4_evm2s1092
MSTFSAASTEFYVDDYSSIQAALDNASRASPSILFFTGGRKYIIGRPAQRFPNASHVLSVVSSSNIVITTLPSNLSAMILITDPTLGFLSLEHCTNVSFMNLIVDYSPRPNAQGFVQAVDASTSSILVDIDASESLENDYFRTAPIRWALIKDRPESTIKSKWNVTLPPFAFTQSSPIEEGDAYVQLARTNDASIFNIYSSLFITFENIKILCAPAGSYIVLNSTAVYFFRVQTSPANGRFQASGADGIFTVGSRSPGHGIPSIIVENSFFEAIGDDGIILKTEPLRLAEPPRTIKSKKEIELSLLGTTWLQQIQEGDKLRFFCPNMSSSIHDLGEGIVTRGALHGLGDSVHVMVANSDGLKLENWPNVFVYNDATTAPFFILRNVSLVGIRRWGALVEAVNGIIEHCLFANTSSQAIMMINSETDNRHGNPMDRDDCSAGSSCASIVGSAIIGDSGLLPWRGHSGITISHNIFGGWQRDIFAVGIAGGQHIVVAK